MKQFADYDKLNEREKVFLTLLDNADKNSLWGLAIENVIKKPSIVTLRKLICDLKSQARDCAPIMKNILGEPGYDYLLTL